MGPRGGRAAEGYRAFWLAQRYGVMSPVRAVVAWTQVLSLLDPEIRVSCCPWATPAPYFTVATGSSAARGDLPAWLIPKPPPPAFGFISLVEALGKLNPALSKLFPLLQQMGCLCL